MTLLKVHLLLLLLSVSVTSVVSLQKRIIGGHDCDDKERLYHVRLEKNKGEKKSYCGASLIHPEWILTAADCFEIERGWDHVPMFKVHPHTAKQQNQEIDYPPVYHISDEFHDIMLLRLRRPVTDVPPVQLPNCNNRLKVGDTVQLAGEGGTTSGPNNLRIPLTPNSSRLQCVDRKIVAVSNIEQISGHVFYAEAPNTDLSVADAGSGVIFNNMIYGVISKYSLRNTFPGPIAVMDVCEYVDWIKHWIKLMSKTIMK